MPGKCYPHLKLRPAGKGCQCLTLLCGAGTAADTSEQTAERQGQGKEETGEARVLVATGEKVTAELTRVAACLWRIDEVINFFRETSLLRPELLQPMLMAAASLGRQAVLWEGPACREALSTAVQPFTVDRPLLSLVGVWLSCMRAI
jgi:hypothetical protein